eukprot:scaffold24382_cov33-Tisochrysis_lutea.AAC.2
MAGVLGIYGLIIAVIIANEVTTISEKQPSYTTYKAFAHFGGGIACGLSGLAAGLAIGIVGESLTQASAVQPKLSTWPLWPDCWLNPFRQGVGMSRALPSVFSFWIRGALGNGT